MTLSQEDEVTHPLSAIGELASLPSRPFLFSLLACSPGGDQLHPVFLRFVVQVCPSCQTFAPHRAFLPFFLHHLCTFLASTACHFSIISITCTASAFSYSCTNFYTNSCIAFSISHTAQHPSALAFCIAATGYDLRCIRRISSSRP